MLGNDTLTARLNAFTCLCNDVNNGDKIVYKLKTTKLRCQSQVCYQRCTGLHTCVEKSLQNKLCDAAIHADVTEIST